MRWAFKRTGAKPLPGGKCGGALGARLGIVVRFRHAFGRRMGVGRSVGRSVVRRPGVRVSRIVHMNFRVGCARRSIAGRFVFGGRQELPAISAKRMACFRLARPSIVTEQGTPFHAGTCFAIAGGCAGHGAYAGSNLDMLIKVDAPVGAMAPPRNDGLEAGKQKAGGASQPNSTSLSRGTG